MKVKNESEVAQSCTTLHDPMDCSLPGSSIHGIFQARVLKWGAIAFSENFVLFLSPIFLMDFLFQLKYFGTDVPFHSKGCAMLERQAAAEWHWSGLPFPSPMHESEK